MRFVEREGKGLLRFESAEDLVQGIHLRALGMEGKFELRGEKEFLGWLYTVARRHVADRHDYWSARRRDGGKLLRLTAAPAVTGTPPRGVDPAASATGPSTVAARREQVALAIRVLESLPPRDRDLVQWRIQEVPIEETAKRLEVSYDAAKHASQRAVERFRKAFELVSRGIDPRRGRAKGAT